MTNPLRNCEGRIYCQILPNEFSCRLCRARFVTELGFDHHLKMEMIIIPENLSLGTKTVIVVHNLLV